MSKPSRDNPVIKPLLAIPICAIKSINRVNYELPIKKNDTKAKEMARHQFELFLEEDFLDYFLSPMYEKHFSPDGKRINTAIQQLEKKELKKHQASPNKKDVLNIKDKYIMEEENRLEEPLSQASMASLNTHYGAWTNREEMWILEDRRLLFATKTDIATQEWAEVLD